VGDPVTEPCTPGLHVISLLGEVCTCGRSGQAALLRDLPQGTVRGCGRQRDRDSTGINLEARHVGTLSQAPGQVGEPLALLLGSGLVLRVRPGRKRDDRRPERKESSRKQPVLPHLDLLQGMGSESPQETSAG
jgi:hypothetical protein